MLYLLYEQTRVKEEESKEEKKRREQEKEKEIRRELRSCHKHEISRRKH